MSFYKRTFVIILAIILIAGCFCCGCERADAGSEYIKEGFAIRFLSLGDGECTAIRFPDGKTALIDGGGKGNSDKIVSCVKSFLSGKIDYLILTSVEEENIGGILSVIDNFEIGSAFVLYSSGAEEFALYCECIEKLSSKTTVKNCQLASSFSGEDYFLAFLSPENHWLENVFENELSSISKEELSEISPIIYLRYKSFKVVLTGDSTSAAQKEILNKSKIGIFDAYYGKGTVDLTDVDIIKLSNHGSFSCFSENLIAELCPKNVLISVSGINPDSLPSTATLNAIYNLNPSIVILRTDVSGDITFFVDENSRPYLSSENAKI